jgi:small subunit ribosomal protein S3
MRAGALGVEILITGKIPSMRARRWRFYNGYLKKSGDIAVEGVRKSIQNVTLKSGAIGVQVSIMPPTIKLPDHITLTESPEEEVEETDVSKTKSKDSNKESKKSEKKAKPKSDKKSQDKPKAESKEDKSEKKEKAPQKKTDDSKKQASSDESADDAEDKK